MKPAANYIAGEWLASSQVAEDINPSNTADVVGLFGRADAKATEQAIAAAKQVFPAWSRGSIQQRHDTLKRIGDEILARKDELGRLLAREEGKTLAEGVGETVRAGQIFLFFAAECVRLAGEKIASVRPGIDIEVTREPLGVVGLITPWNFPIAIPAWKIGAALAFGNTVVFKPADLTPACGWALVDILVRAGVPNGVLNLVMGRGSVVGNPLVDGVDAITFTGSVPTGRNIAVRAIGTMTKIQLEMGGKNALVILDDADLDVAVECTVNGAFYGTGQRCTASERIIVTEGIHDRFINAVKERMAKTVVGHALKKGTQIGPVVDEKQLEHNLKYVEIARRDGATIFGGERLERETPGFYMSPALMVGTDNAMQINREEVFGPVASIIRVKNYDEALVKANDSEFGLSSGICTTSLKYAKDFQRNSESGLVMVNLPTAGLDYHVPFGGRKGSSYGPREQGTYAVEFFTTVKTTYMNP